MYFCPYRRKEVISVPLSHAKEIFTPGDCLKRIASQLRRDDLENLALEFILMLSSEANVDFNFFGIHGSIALGMHSNLSDIDIVVYGAENFRRVERAIENLVANGVLKYIFANKLDKIRRHRGIFKGKIFVYNAVRKFEEVNVKYGENIYEILKPIRFQCRILDDSEAIFRPAIYRIGDYNPLNSESDVEEKPTYVVSMIGAYRNIAKRWRKIEVSGMLECVKNIETGKSHYQVVVGTGFLENEYIWPVEP